jgi:transcriptional regulator with XRE-family HTH domain
VSLLDRIQWTRRRQGLSLRELARRLGLDPGTVEAWETGAIVKPFARIAEIFERYVEGV